VTATIFEGVMDDQTSPTLIGISREPAPRRRPWIRIIVIILVVGGLVGAGVLYWLDARHYETTDDAFIDAHVSQVSAQISGRITKLLIKDNQPVTAGQVLAEIDPRDMQARLDQMLAQRDQAAAQLAQARATLPARQADVAQDDAQIRVQQADADQSGRDLARYTHINPRAITAQTVDQARNTARSAEAKLDAARSTQAGARAQLAVARTQVAAAEAALRTAEANVAEARLQLDYTRILAPSDGRIARRTLELGNYVTPGQALLAIVQPACWVTANLKESQLGHLTPGQHATITVDAYPDQKLNAHVDSLQSGTGSVFSSLPAENATGNYVKIVQRLPVKLVFDDPNTCSRLHLATGMSVEPRIKVR
jgi:membrane fusion protein (multidrug efflux system)